MFKVNDQKHLPHTKSLSYMSHKRFSINSSFYFVPGSAAYRKNFRNGVPLGTGYRANFRYRWVPVGKKNLGTDGYRVAARKKFWVPRKFSLMPP